MSTGTGMGLGVAALRFARRIRRRYLPPDGTGATPAMRSTYLPMMLVRRPSMQTRASLAPRLPLRFVDREIAPLVRFTKPESGTAPEETPREGILEEGIAEWPLAESRTEVPSAGTPAAVAGEGPLREMRHPAESAGPAPQPFTMADVRRALERPSAASAVAGQRRVPAPMASRSILRPDGTLARAHPQSQLYEPAPGEPPVPPGEQRPTVVPATRAPDQRLTYPAPMEMPERGEERPTPQEAGQQEPQEGAGASPITTPPTPRGLPVEPVVPQTHREVGADLTRPGASALPAEPPGTAGSLRPAAESADRLQRTLSGQPPRPSSIFREEPVPPTPEREPLDGSAPAKEPASTLPAPALMPDQAEPSQIPPEAAISQPLEDHGIGPGAREPLFREATQPVPPGSAREPGVGIGQVVGRGAAILPRPEPVEPLEEQAAGEARPGLDLASAYRAQLARFAAEANAQQGEGEVQAGATPIAEPTEALRSRQPLPEQRRGVSPAEAPPERPPGAPQAPAWPFKGTESLQTTAADIRRIREEANQGTRKSVEMPAPALPEGRAGEEQGLPRTQESPQEGIRAPSVMGQVSDRYPAERLPEQETPLDHALLREARPAARAGVGDLFVRRATSPGPARDATPAQEAPAELPRPAREENVGTDIDEIAERVLAKLRDRLRTERERMGGSRLR